MITVNKDFSHCYNVNGKYYLFKGKKIDADRELIKILIANKIIEYKKVFDYTI